MRRRLRWAAAPMAVLAVVVAGFFWFLGAVDAPPAPERRTDAIVVLTGGAERVRTGLDLGAVLLHVDAAGLRQQHVVVEVPHLHLLKVLHLLRRSRPPLPTKSGHSIA